MTSGELRRALDSVISFPIRQGSGGSMSLAPGGGDGHPPGMEAEIAVLKQRADQADQRMARVEDKLDRIEGTLTAIQVQLGGVATKGTVWAALGTGAGIAFAVVALFVGVLAYLQDQRVASKPEAPTPAAAPIVIQLPPWPAQPPGPPTPTPAPPG